MAWTDWTPDPEPQWLGWWSRQCGVIELLVSPAGAWCATVASDKGGRATLATHKAEETGGNIDRAKKEADDFAYQMWLAMTPPLTEVQRRMPTC